MDTIYKNYNNETLNRQYNNRLQSPGFATHFERQAQWNKETAATLKPIRDISYGEHPREKLDVYLSKTPNAKALVFIHGGYWQALDKNDFQFVATAFESLPVTVFIISYPLAPEASMATIVSSCKKAIDWVIDNAENYNANKKSVYLAGHSAGGHLVSMILTSNKDVRGACTLSGVFNLVPIQKTTINDAIKMKEQDAVDYSATNKEPAGNPPLIIAVGGDESDEFKAQSAELTKAWNKKAAAQLIEVPGINHYSIVECFAEKGSILHNAMCAMMEL